MKQTILVTGPTNGIGRATALALAADGHRLILLCRNAARGRALCEEIAQLQDARPTELLIADLGDTYQVHDAAERFLALGEPLHVLINNAGIVNTKRVAVDVEGSEQEQMFAVNHLGHFLLTRLLLPKLLETAEATQRPSRIVAVSSEANALFCRGIDFDDLSQKKSFKGFRAYGRSKLANILMVRELARRVDRRLLLANSLHPGAVKSQLGRNIESKWYTRIATAFLHLFFITPEQGADTSVFLATGNVDTHGEYYYRRKIRRLKPWARDDETAAKLWELSEDILKLK
jgi:retinol dehydrogenase-12